jgi:hypothetical protein
MFSMFESAWKHVKKKFLNRQNKEFLSKQNLNNLMIKMYFLHTSQEPIRKLDIWLCGLWRHFHVSCTNETRLIDQSELAYYLNYFIIGKWHDLWRAYCLFVSILAPFAPSLRSGTNGTNRPDRNHVNIIIIIIQGQVKQKDELYTTLSTTINRL